MVPIAPPSLVDKVSTAPLSDGSLLTAGEDLLFIRNLLISKCFPKEYFKILKGANIYCLDNYCFFS